MSKYSKATILKYINGLNPDGYNIEDLENDKFFMMEVIEYTKDKELYNLCSESVKKDYEFIKFMINTFKDDKDYIIKLAKDYINSNSSKDTTVQELIIIMADLLSPLHEVNEFNVKALAFYNSELINLEVVKKIDIVQESYPNFGRGFYYLEAKYTMSNEIKMFFAKKFLTDIFYNSEVGNFEQFIHTMVKSSEEIDLIGNKKFILNIIKHIDEFLYGYVICHMELIDKYLIELEKVKDNWYLYTKNLNELRVDIYYQEVERYALTNSDVDVERISYYVKKNLGLLDIFKEYGFESEEYTYELFPEEENVTSINEIKCLRYLTALARSLFESEIIKKYENDSYLTDESELTMK